MTNVRIAVLTGMCSALALCGCSRDDIESAENTEQLRKGELPAAIATRERLAAEERAEQGAPIPSDSKRDDDERADDPLAPRAATSGVVAESATLRRAEAELDTVGKAKLDAKATFVERSDGVAVVVNVADAKPGTRSVRIYDRESCDDLEKEGLGQPLDTTIKDGNLGSVTIGPSGKGTLETKAPASTLKPDDRASLLGKTIVVQERSDGDSPKAAGDAIACGVIRLDHGLADKAGRMTEPVR